MKKITELFKSKINRSLSTTQDDLYHDHAVQINHTLVKLKNLFQKASVK
ncbi:MAG: hypothetical protein GY756_10240 [bacterium]|nr:hypothetical protein [bacterium]